MVDWWAAGEGCWSAAGTWCAHQQLPASQGCRSAAGTWCDGQRRVVGGGRKWLVGGWNVMCSASVCGGQWADDASFRGREVGTMLPSAAGKFGGRETTNQPTSTVKDRYPHFHL